MDESYHTYLNRVARLTLPATYESKVQHIQESPKFQPKPSGGRDAVSFPGYSVITPPGADDAKNQQLYDNLKLAQEQLLQQLGTDVLIPVPPGSFHFTVADLIWDNAYRDALKDKPDFEAQLAGAISRSFEQCRNQISSDRPIQWQLVGIMVMPRALAVCFVPKDESSYEKILQFRRCIYQNPALIGLGIEQQYHFTAHVTLGYFGDISDEGLRDRLSSQLTELNQQWQDTPQSFWINQAQLRKFDDMTRYYRQSDWPVFEF